MTFLNIKGICCYKKGKTSKIKSRKDRLLRLYDEGADRLDEEICIEKIIKHIRDMRIYLN